MSIFDGIPDPDAPVSDRDGVLEAARKLDFRAVATFLGCAWDKKQRHIRCPNAAQHKQGDRHPSAMVYPDHIYCYSCGSYIGVIDLVMLMQGLDFNGAVSWLADNIEAIGGVSVPPIETTETSYIGPAPVEIVDYWHSCFTSEYRRILYKRLITDETIDLLRLGWRPDWKAVSIPFWRGRPGISEVDIVQFRLTEGPSRYIGLRRHNRPSIVPAHSIGLHSVVMLFGTFDAILASQDGIAAISPNGATAFKSDESIARLKEMLGGCKVYLVPDCSETETRPAYALARKINAQVCHFPADWGIKDYTEFRQAGGKPTEFLREVLMIGNGFIQPEHDEWFTDFLRNMAEGNCDAVETFLLVFEEHYKLAPIVNQHLQLRMQLDPFIGLTHEQWNTLREDITTKLTYPKLTEWARTGCEMAHRNRGGF